MILILKIVRKKNILINLIKDYKISGKIIGFVPTMGALHEGHISLLNASKRQNSITICSIYVNPTQFDNKKDLSFYPKNELKDIQILKRMNCDVLFLPNNTEMYPDNVRSLSYNFTDCFNILEGEKRPGHFAGVVTIVHKLFELIQPANAYFGEKDFQQLWIIKKFIKSHSLNIKINSCVTIRNKLGLALSSRNSRLSDSEKHTSTLLFQCIYKLKMAIENLLNANSIEKINKSKILNLKAKNIQPIISNSIIKLDYCEIVDIENFSFVTILNRKKKYRILIAAYVGKTRLIDNISIN
ncbi:MAG: pantoate--beta-alanine ligase [Flavobacteriales bacterium]|nr:pantoate--beta-alanine ligase [Flavobacteriales bacterium]